jgi:UDP-N-acetylglucosamine 2-epimerase (non-hydrolysing)
VIGTTKVVIPKRRFMARGICCHRHENTERPITISLGTNQLVGRDLKKLRSSAEAILQQKPTPKDEIKPVPFCDGHAAERIARVIMRGSSN